MDAEIIEIYVPRRLEYLSALYAWLRNELRERPSRALFRGFSLYEVSGAYRGDVLYTEQTLVVRLIFDVPSDDERLDHEAKIQVIADHVVEITGNQEEELWLLRMPARKMVRHRRRTVYASVL